MRLVENTLCILIASFLFIWCLYEGSVLESPYPDLFVKLYNLPLWRFSLVILLLVATDWSPYIGILLTLAIFYYIEDFEKLTKEW
jgi:hypothetical protein